MDKYFVRIDTCKDKTHSLEKIRVFVVQNDVSPLLPYSNL